MNGDVPVVSNAGPLTVLAKLNVLHLLKALYGRVQITQSVYDEVVVEGLRQGYEDAKTLQLFLNQVGWGPEEVKAEALPRVVQLTTLDSQNRWSRN